MKCANCTRGCKTKCRYQEFNTTDKRREQNREAQRRWREKQKEKKKTEGTFKGHSAEYWYDMYENIAQIADTYKKRYRQEVQSKRSNAPSGSFDDFVKAVGGKKVVLQLLHPDKHGGKATATRATQWVIANTR